MVDSSLVLWGRAPVYTLNIVMTVGLKGAIGIFLPAKGSPDQILPPSDPAPAEPAAAE